jgi:polysaccharide export outer membrane protein
MKAAEYKTRIMMRKTTNRTWMAWTGAVLLCGTLALTQPVFAQNAKNPQTPVPLAPTDTPPAGVTADAFAPGAPPPDTSSGPQLEVREQRYKVHAGDSFDITFELSPEFNQTGVAIQPDGFVTLRGVSDLQVDGQTVAQLTETLRAAYGKILHDPIISVTLKDFEKPYFIADGQIGRPGKYDLRGSVTLTQALAIAGGLSDSAKHSQVMLFRRINDQWLEAKLYNVKKMEKSGKLDEDPFLHPGDMLFVPKNTFSKISRFIPQASLGTMLTPY